MKTRRFLELDLLRGLAVVGMIIFHLFYLLNYFEVMFLQMFSGWWHVLGQFVRFSFLGLVGVGMVISYNKVLGNLPDAQRGGIFCWKAVLRQWCRAGIIFVLALIVSFATLLVIPDQYVKFGILHLIATSIFVLSFVVRLPVIALIFGIAAIFLGKWLSGFTTNSLILFVFGMKSETIFSIDYFPIFPWISVICFGIFLGNLLYAGKFRMCLEKFVFHMAFKPILFLGRHSLVIYMLHMPVIIFLLWIVWGVKL